MNSDRVLRLYRRRLILTILSAPLALSGRSRADDKLRTVGILSIAGIQEWYAPFYQKLEQLGWIEGKNIAFEFRHAGGDPYRFAQPLS